MEKSMTSSCLFRFRSIIIICVNTALTFILRKYTIKLFKNTKNYGQIPTHCACKQYHPLYSNCSRSYRINVSSTTYLKNYTFCDSTVFYTKFFVGSKAALLLRQLLAMIRRNNQSVLKTLLNI